MNLSEEYKLEINEYNHLPIHFKEVTKQQFENFIITECVVSVASKQVHQKEINNKSIKSYLQCNLFGLEYALEYPIGYGIGIDGNEQSIYFTFGSQEKWNEFSTIRCKGMK